MMAFLGIHSLMVTIPVSAVFSQIFLATIVQSALIGDHICYRNESFTELDQRRSTEPVRIREYGWCLGFPPRCSKYRTETKEIVKYQNVTRSRTVEGCCEGFVSAPVNGSGNTTKCIPNCPNGCENGVCSEPHKCECFIGYEGVTCLKACDKGSWGLKCSEKCDCPSFSCDPVSGVCIECLEGWTGHGCNTKCSKGFYGRDCKHRCSSCINEECDFKTGDCLIKPTTPTPQPITTTTTIRTVPTILPPTSPPPPSPTPSLITSTHNNLLHIHTIDAKSTNNSMAITVLNTSISSRETNVKNLERQVIEHKRLISSTTTTTATTPVDLTFIELSTAAVGGAVLDAAAGDSDEAPRVLIATQEEHHIVEVPLDPLTASSAEVFVQLDNSSEATNLLPDKTTTTVIEDKVERHGSILIALIAVLCVIAIGCMGYVCLRRRCCFIFAIKSGKVKPHATELIDIKTIDKPLPAIPLAHEHRVRSGSVKSVTFDEKLTYYGESPMDRGAEAEAKSTEVSFAHHIYDEVKYPPTLTDHKNI